MTKKEKTCVKEKEQRRNKGRNSVKRGKDNDKPIQKTKKWLMIIKEYKNKKEGTKKGKKKALKRNRVEKKRKKKKSRSESMGKKKRTKYERRK